jgi:hypothetical protein
MDRKWILLVISPILAFALFFAPPRVYRIVGAPQQELSSNARFEAGIANLSAYVASQAQAHGVNPRGLKSLPLLPVLGWLRAILPLRPLIG